jgi:hypothetical protein
MAGRKAHEATEDNRRKVEAMAGYGLPQDQIAKVMQVAESTLKKYYAEELSRGVAVANSMIGEALFKRARAGNTAALIFWAKARMGWRETLHVDNTSSDRSMSPKGSDADALEQIHARLDRLASKG